jgi:hypothetical protein
MVLLVCLIALRVRVVDSLEDMLAQEMNRSISVMGQRTLFPLSRLKMLIKPRPRFCLQLRLLL